MSHYRWIRQDIKFKSIDPENNNLTIVSIKGYFTIKFMKDEWFKVRIVANELDKGYSFRILHFKCDQFVGLIKLLDKFL